MEAELSGRVFALHTQVQSPILSQRKKRYIEQKSSVLVTRKLQDPFGGILVSLIKQFKNRHRRMLKDLIVDCLAFERKTTGQAVPG